MNAPASLGERTDIKGDRRALVVATAVLLASILLMGIVHNAIVSRLLGTDVPVTLWWRAIGNVLVVVAMPILAVALGAHRASNVWGALRAIVPAAALASLSRVAGVIWLSGGLTDDLATMAIAEWLGGVSICICAALLAFFYVRSQRALRVEERISGERATQRELALRSLEKEEVRVRRSIAEGLHGSLQQRLVIQSIRLEILVERAEALGTDAEVVESLRELREDVEQIREHDVREMSRMLYPEGIEIGLVPAIRILLRRLPPGIATSLDVSDEVRMVDDPTTPLMSQSARLLAVRFVEEAVTNGLRHGNATAFTVSVVLVESALVIEVANNGLAMDPAAVEAGSGLRRLNERFELDGGMVEIVGAGGHGNDQAGGAEASTLSTGFEVRMRGVLPLGDLWLAGPDHVAKQVDG